MNSETKQCQNCKNDFIIESDDFSFYEKIKVPSPTWCPECRLIRRLASREDRPLYKDKCDKCKKEIISIYSHDVPVVVYCSSCWWRDEWDAIDYGKDYDFSRNFFEQFYELQKVIPHEATSGKNSTNCQYSNGNIRCKDCILTFDGFESINCYNCESPGFSRDSLDSDVIVNADHTYETINSNGVYNTKFTYFSDECLDCSFVFNCIGCTSCFGCVNLRNQKYCIFNKKYSKEEYQNEIKKWDLGSYEVRKKTEKLFWELYYKIPRKFAMIKNSSNVIGDNLQSTKNSLMCFETLLGVENCKYIAMGGLLLKDSYDVVFGGDHSELFYENNGGVQSSKCFFGRAPNESTNLEYSVRIFNSSFLFGCTMLKNKKYCILNKQYTKEEYEELIPKIKQHMIDMPFIDKKGRIYKYGEYFPIEHSLWAYNETWASKYFSLTKEQAIEKGFNWYDEKERDYKITIKSEDLPDHIDKVSDSILNEVISCEHLNKDCNQQCTKVFRILPNEFQFYKQMKVALPRLCPSCRYRERIKKKNPFKLWHRKCMCNGESSKSGEYQNTVKHFHEENPCSNEFETAISEERKEMVYCEKCYQAEFI
jgi:hypothetical protein